MTTGLRAIETQYKGYRFRSRLEARWAVFFDALNVSWEYEREGFHLSDGGRYLPDFWLPDLKCWLEIKGSEPGPDELLKVKSFGKEIVNREPSLVLIAVGLPCGSGQTDLRTWFNARLPKGDIWACPACRSIRLSGQLSLPYLYGCLKCYETHQSPPIGLVEHDVRWGRSVYWDLQRSDPKYSEWISEPILHAAEAARAARFEFGENGAPPPQIKMAPRATFTPAVRQPEPAPENLTPSWDLAALRQRWPSLRLMLWSTPIDRATFNSCDLVDVEGHRLVLRMSSGNLMLLKDEKKRAIRQRLRELLGSDADVRFIDDKTPSPARSKWEGLGVGGKTVRAHWETDGDGE